MVGRVTTVHGASEGRPEVPQRPLLAPETVEGYWDARIVVLKRQKGPLSRENVDSGAVEKNIV